MKIDQSRAVCTKQYDVLLITHTTTLKHSIITFLPNISNVAAFSSVFTSENTGNYSAMSVVQASDGSNAMA